MRNLVTQGGAVLSIDLALALGYDAPPLAKHPVDTLILFMAVPADGNRTCRSQRNCQRKLVLVGLASQSVYRIPFSDSMR